MKIAEKGVLVQTDFTGTVAQLVECLLCDREVAGSIPGRVMPKTFKMILAALLLGAHIKKVEVGIRTGQLSVSIM